MAARIAATVLLAAVAVVIAAFIRRRSTNQPVRTSWTVPSELDRTAFPSPHAPWLLVTFTASTCDTCRGVLDRIAPLCGRDEVACFNAERSETLDLHEQLRIDAVPTTVLVDRDGVVRASLVGPASDADIARFVTVLDEHPVDLRSPRPD